MEKRTQIFRFTTGKQYFFSTFILFFFITILYYTQSAIGYETVSLILLLIIFLLPIFNFEKGPIILAAVISALAWDYYFIPPHFTLHIDSTEDGVMLFMFFIVALTNGILTSQLRTQKKQALDKEKQLNSQLDLWKELSFSADLDSALNKIVDRIFRTFGTKSVVYLPENEDKINRTPHPASNFKPDEMGWLAALTTFKEKNEVGKSTDSMYGTEAIYFPIKDNGSVICVIGIKINDEIKFNPDDMEFLREFVKDCGAFVKKYLGYSTP